MDEPFTPPTPAQIDALLLFLTSFEREGFVASWPHPILKDKSLCIREPLEEWAPELEAFHKAVYNEGFLFPFNWSHWDQADRYINQPEALEQADLLDLCRLLTLHVRAEHFGEGHLSSMVMGGHISRLLRRLQALRFASAAGKVDAAAETLAVQRANRSRGCLLGLAIGDALGAPVEFSPPGSFEPVTTYRAGGVFNLEAGQWTDDSSMALCLAESLLERGELDLSDQLERYWRWYRHGENSINGRCFDIGNGTRSALERWRRAGDLEAGSPEGLGNGALMRLAPVPIFWQHDPPLAGAMAARSARTTHGHPLALASAAYFGELLARALRGDAKADLLGPWWKGSEAWDPEGEVRRIAHGSWREARIRARGHALRSLEAALWAFGSTGSFEACVLAAVNLGDDADTVGAIAGQLAGAHYGLVGIPGGLISDLQQHDRFLNLADGLSRTSLKR